MNELMNERVNIYQHLSTKEDEQLLCINLIKQKVEAILS